MPLVSVVMPSYNHARFISQSIDSVLRQDINDFELIIVDDASNDTSQQIIERYAEQESRVKAIFHDSNAGIAKTFNDGIEMARGRFIAQLASDDVWVKNKLRRQLAVVEQDENLVVWCEGEVIDLKGQPIGKSFSEFHGNVSKKKSGNIFQELLKGNYIFGTTLVYKNTNLGEIRYDESLMYLNDYKFNLDLAREYEFYYIAEPLAKYRLHGRNTLTGSRSEVMKRRQIAKREYASILEEAIRQYDHEITLETKANMYASLAGLYYDLGEKKKSLRSLLQAVRYNPSYPKLVLKRTLSNLVSSRT
jgi:teichuronic acid biosynthesis glycosyltransferase TuaG